MRGSSNSKRKSPRPQSTREFVVAVDTGGTFTDFIWIDGGRTRMLKVFSTPDDPSRAIAEGLRQIMKPASDCDYFTGPPWGRMLYCSARVRASRL